MRKWGVYTGISFGLFLAGVLAGVFFYSNTNAVSSIKTPPQIVPTSKEISLVFAGDVMMHGPQRTAGYVPEIDSYNFDAVFEPVLPLVKSADIAVVNLETPVAGISRGYFGYPNFNAPVQLIDALRNTGFDVVSIANNHALDMGVSGLLATQKNITDRNLTVVGGSQIPNQLYEPVYQDVSGVRVAIIAASYGFNGYVVPADKKYTVNQIDEAQLIAAIRKAQLAKSDAIFVFLHWGNEYERTPTEYQKTLAQSLLNAGATGVVGAHPHVLQPVEQYTTIDGRKTVIAYSLGNFVSNQRKVYQDLGGLFLIRVRKNFEKNETVLSSFELVPTWVYRGDVQGKRVYRIVPLAEIDPAQIPLETDRQKINLYQASYLKNQIE